ncbi:MAG: aminopeptidase [Thermoplasmatota archaeon]
MARDVVRAARVAIETVLGVGGGERILIITNPHEDGQLISRALYDAASDRGASPVLITQPVKTQLDFAEDSVLSAIRSEPDVLISISRRKLGKDRWALRRPYRVRGKKLDSAFQYLLAKKRTRSFWSPGVTADIFARTVPVDYGRMRRDCRALSGVLDRAESVRITTRRGTNLTVGLKGRRCHLDDGDFSRPGKGGNLPAGEVFISPALGSSRGRVVFDGSVSTDRGEVVIKAPIVADVEGGLVRRISGGREARLLRQAVERGALRARGLAREGRIPKSELGAYVTNVRNLGELGIGVNRAARIVGNVLEDEKVYRTCHIALGSNYDNDAPALTHYDGVVREPTMVACMPGGRERTLLESGRLMV